MEFKGTSGNWKANNLFGNWIVCYEEKGEDLVLEIRDNKANALLISKAPEMLEMLIKIHGITTDEDIKCQVELLIKEATEL